MKARFFCYLLVFLLYACCSPLPEVIRDETDLHQNHASYISDASKTKRLLTPVDQAQMNAEYDKMYFSVWHSEQPAHLSLEKLVRLFKQFALNPGYGENKRKLPESWVKKLEQNALLNQYPNFRQRAITIRPSNLRALPTMTPHFSAQDGNIAAWPFDNLQISSVPANTPICLYHLSADKSWALVETSFAFGWMPSEDFALVDEDFIGQWESGRYATIVRDKFHITDVDGRFSLRTSLGQVFPLIRPTDNGWEILMAVADQDKKAFLKHAQVPDDVVAPKPLAFTYANAVNIANQLIEEPYGWGGLYGNRDCSALTRDFFAPFGIWLPRHSEDQAKKAGRYIDLRGLDPEQKERIILEKGIPYGSLLWRKGHIMLFIGEDRGRALVFHNIWGLRVIDCSGKENRKVIGKAIITTLYPGKEIARLDQEGLLIKHIDALTLLVPSPNPTSQP